MTTTRTPPGSPRPVRLVRPRSRRGTREAQRGSAVLELALLVPVLVLVALFIVALGRLGDARARLDQATYTAARAASLTRDPAAATTAARQAATGSLPPAVCAGLTVNVDTTAFTAGGTVTVRIRCTVNLSDLGLGLPVTKTLTGQSTSGLDRFRAATS